MADQKRRAAVRGFGDTVKNSINLEGKSAFVNPSIEQLNELYAAIGHLHDSIYLKLDQTTPQTIIGSNHIPISATAPSNPIEGSLYINSTNHKMYVYYTDQWQVLHTLSVTAPAIVAGNPIGLLLSLTYAGTP